MLTSSIAATASAIADSAHLIQVALTPVFLLTAIAGFLNVFTGRLARVADRVNDSTRARDEGRPAPAGFNGTLLSLRRRTLALQAAVLLAGGSGAFTCAATVTIFVGALGTDLTAILFVEFVLAMLCLLGGLGCFVAEMLIASGAMVTQIAADRTPN